MKNTLVKHRVWKDDKWIMKNGISPRGTIVYPSNRDASTVSVVATHDAVENYNKVWLLTGRYPGDADMKGIKAIWNEFNIELVLY